MDKFIYLVNLISVVFCSNLIYCQKDSNLTQAEYEMVLNFETYPYFESKLILNDTSSIFIYKSKQNQNLTKLDDNGNNVVFAPDNTQFLIVNNVNDNELKEIRSSVKKVGIKNYKTSLKWNLVNDTIKKIGKYHCKFAHAKYEVRTYYAWYAPDIPVSFGPWKLHSLPGLIIEAGDTENMIYFKIKNLSKNIKPLPKVPLKNYTFYLKPKFDSIIDAKFQARVKNMRSKMPRGLKVSYKTGTKEEIEK